MVETTLLYTEPYVTDIFNSFSTTVIDVPEDVQTALINCKPVTAEYLPPSVCDNNGACYGRYKTFTVFSLMLSPFTSKPNGKCDVFTRKAYEPTPTTNYLVIDFCNPMVSTITKNTKTSIKGRSTQNFNGEKPATYINTYTVKPSIYTTKTTLC